MDDAELVRRLQAGDASGWAEVYDRYADRLHDYCASILRDRHEAEDALHDAFVTASQRIGQLRDPARLRPWLYAICRTTALGRVRRRSRVVPTEDVGAVVSAPESVDPVERDELRRLVWEAAGGLAPQDRAVLDLHLRHGLVGADLAEALDVSPHHATVRLGRVRDLVERSLTVLLVGRLGRRDCPELDALLAGWDGRLEPRLRKRVARHIDGCDVCEERRRAVVSPLALLAAMPLAPAPAHLRDRVLTSVSRGAPLSPPSVGPLEGPPPTGGPWRRRRALVAAAAAAAVVAIAGGVAIGAGNDEPKDVAAIESTAPHAPSSTSTSAASSTTTEPTSTTAPPPPIAAARLLLLTGSQDLGPSATHATIMIRNAGGEPLAWTAAIELAGAVVEPAAGTVAPGATSELQVVVDRAALPEGAFEGAVLLEGRRADGGPAGGARAGITGLTLRAPVLGEAVANRASVVVGPNATTCPTTVRAAVSDESPLTVVLRWTGGGSTATESRAMVADDGDWVATLGPPSGGGEITWWIEAADSFGAASRGPDHQLPIQTFC